MEELVVHGHRVAFVREGSGPALICLHNGGTSHSIWLPMMERLRDRYTVVAVDLIGYGASDHPASGVTMDLHVAMLEGLVRELGLSSPTLVGNCMGSAISLTYASRHPGGARALVLVNPLTRETLGAGRLGSFLRFRTAMPKVAGAVYAAAGKLRLPRFTAGPILATQLGASGRRQGLDAHDPLVACHASDGQLCSLLQVLEDIDAYGAIDDFQKPAEFPPMMVLWGAQNKVLPAPSIERLNRALRPERTAVIQEGGHLAMLEEPAEVAAKVDEFLRGLGRPSEREVER